MIDRLDANASITSVEVVVRKTRFDHNDLEAEAGDRARTMVRR